jgi:hypothetical protein
MRTHWLIVIWFGAASWCSGQTLQEAQHQAGRAALEFQESRAQRRGDMEEIKEGLRRLSKDLEDGSDPSAQVLEVRAGRAMPAALAPVLDRLARLYRDISRKTYTQPYREGLKRAVARHLRWAADRARDKRQLIQSLLEQLSLPDRIDAAGFLKEGVSVEEFIAQGPIKVFLAKHRLARPASYVRTTAEDIVAGRHPVQIGVEVEGTVVVHEFYPFDGDYTFDFGGLHMEITLEWRLSHPRMHRPVTGDRVRVRGWTYYDYFHDNEAGRDTVWEIHPVMDVELLPAAAS